MSDDLPPDYVRIPPHSHEAECSVLGALLNHNESWDKVADLIGKSDFYRHEHKLAFGAIGALINASKPADVITVFEHLQRAGDPVELVYLNGLAVNSASSANIRRYAEIVRERAVLRKLAQAGNEIAADALAAEGRPVKDVLDASETKILAIGEETGRINAGSTEITNLVVQLLDMVQERADNPRDILGTPTGFYDLDKMTSGLQAGDLIILAARPSMGKTSLAMNIAEHVAIKEGLPVAVFSMEMGSLQLTLRMVGSVGRIDQMRLRRGALTDEEWPRLTEAIETMRQVKMEIDETAGLSIGEMRSKARRIKRQFGGLGLIVVDYLQLMSTTGKENRATELGEISRGLKMLAKELQCPLIALSQLSRAVESRTDKRPMMSDLRESGAIEQDADVIMFIYRDDYYNKDSKEPGVAEVIIGKQRNGPTGTVKMVWVKEYTKFESMARASDDF